jgi:multidrug efflux pump subunit AcrB
VLWREGRKYAVTVQGDVVDGMQGPTVTAQIWPKLRELSQQMPPEYGIQVAGAVEESNKGTGSIAAGRSEERRVGKECRRLCRSRWSPYH